MDLLFSLFTLVLMEIVLGIDNIVFIAILVERIPRELQQKARLIGLSLALLMRVALLFSINWIMSLTRPLFTLFSKDISGRDLILISGGLFLVWKSTHEIFQKLELQEKDQDLSPQASSQNSFKAIIFQIVLLDLVFSLDSVITAVGMSNSLAIMISAVVISLVFMLFASGPISSFIHDHPSLKVLALAFLILIGTLLLGEGLGQHIPRGYIYFAMCFSLIVELINIRTRKKISTH